MFKYVWIVALAFSAAYFPVLVMAAVAVRRPPRWCRWTVAASVVAAAAAAAYGMQGSPIAAVAWTATAAINLAVLGLRVRRLRPPLPELVARCARLGHGPVAMVPEYERTPWRARGSFRACWACHTPLTVRQGMQARRDWPVGGPRGLFLARFVVAFLDGARP